jgi:lysophospholipase L1-like esterase
MSFLQKKRFIGRFIPPNIIIVTRLPAPSGFSARGGDSEVVLEFTNNPLASQYKLFRSEGNDSNYQFLRNLPGQDDNSDTRTVTDETVTNNTRYYYELRANNAAGDSQGSYANATPKEDVPTGELNGIGFLGDSNTNLEGYVTANRRWPYLVAEGLSEDYWTNLGVGGATTKSFLTPSKMEEWKSKRHAIYVLTFGAKDYDTPGMTAAIFKEDNRRLINEVKDLGAEAILATVKHYDFAGGHHSFNRNNLLLPYVNAYRQLAEEEDVKVVDFFAATKELNDAYNAGDTSTRTLYGTAYPKWQTHLNSTDNTWTNVHLNDYGSKVLAEETIKVIQGTTGGGGGGGGTPGAATVRTFSAHQNDVANPERGITINHRSHSSNDSATGIGNQPKALPTPSGLVTLAKCIWVLQDFRNSAISTAFMTRIEDDLKIARNGGFKVIPAFAYWYNGPQTGNGETARDLNISDTNENRIKAHIEQLAPLLNQYKDVIAWMQAGFMGAWGEGNKSCNGLDYDGTPSAAVKRIFDHLLDYIHTDIMIGCRYPPALQHMYGSAVTESGAYSGSDISRLMLFDDYMGEVFPSSFNQAQSLWTGQNGEGVPNGFDSGNIGGNRGIDYLKAGHFSAIQPIGDPHLSSWNSAGVWDDIQRGLGYRFALLESRIPSTIPRGGTFNVILKIKNDGFANPINKRLARIVLRNNSTGIITRLTAFGDIRKNYPNPGATKDVTHRVTIPAGQPTGNYQVFLELPDPAYLDPKNNHLRFSARVTSRDASGNDIFQSATGFNLIGATVVS